MLDLFQGKRKNPKNLQNLAWT